jgi:hypothetical protein
MLDTVAYRRPLTRVDRIRVRVRGRRSRPDFAALYVIAAGAGVVSGYVLTVLA